MKALLLCLSLGFASAAGAHPIEKAVCRTTEGAVSHMALSEKVCRSFALALVELPNATAHEAQAVLTPENLATMSALTTMWAASQGVPVVGEAVDAALATLGIILLAAQAVDLAHALWDYAKIVATAQRPEDLRTASTHLARAVALVGVNVVTFILTKKFTSKLNKQPPPHESSLKPATEPALASAEPTGAPARPPSTQEPLAAIRTEPPVASPAVSAPRVVVVNAIIKRINPQAFKQWLESAPRREVSKSSSEAAMKFQQKQTGDKEILVKGGDKQVWADGTNTSDAHLVEVKHVEKPDISPYVEGSRCNEGIRAMVRDQMNKEFERYAAVIHDPGTPAAGLEVILNDTRAIPFFESLMRQFKIPGRIRIDPERPTP